MKFLWVLENYHPHIGGVETLFKKLETRLLAQGHTITVITARPIKGSPRKEKRAGFLLIRLPFRSRYLFTLLTWPMVWYHARRCDVVHTTSYNAALPAWIGAKLARKKVIVTFHEVWGDLWFRLPFMSRLSKQLHFWFEKMLLKLPFDQFVAVSHSTASNLKKYGVKPSRVKVIYNGINYEEFGKVQAQIQTHSPSRSHTVFTYTYFGRLGISKGLDLLLPAAAAVRKVLPQSQLQLIVPTSDKKMLKWLHQAIILNEIADYVQIRNNLTFEELKSAIVQSTCVVIPSYSEGFCFAAVEAMALGTPIISSGRGALREVVGGEVIEIESLTIEALENAISKAYQKEWEKRPVRKFELTKQVADYLKLYETLSKKVY